MKSSSRFTILVLTLTFGFLSACSQDEGDGKEEKGKAQELTQASTQACATSDKSHDKLRQDCYLGLLKSSPELVNELGGANPFIVKTWDQADFSNSNQFMEISSCRAAFPKSCAQ